MTGTVGLEHVGSGLGLHAAFCPHGAELGGFPSELVSLVQQSAQSTVWPPAGSEDDDIRIAEENPYPQLCPSHIHRDVCSCFPFRVGLSLALPHMWCRWFLGECWFDLFHFPPGLGRREMCCELLCFCKES